MKTSFGQGLDRLIWGNYYTYYNKVGYSAPYISFFSMQMIRLINFIIVFLIWATNIYINMKKGCLYIYMWGLTFATLALGYLFVSSGRQVVERKMEEKGDPVDSKDKSTTWKHGVFFYTLALPFVFTANILFYVFLRNDLKDQIVRDLLREGESDSWRIYFIWAAHIVPLLALMIDFALNRLVMAYWHVLISIALTGLYFFGTYVGQLAQQTKAIYLHHLSWMTDKNSYTGKEVAPDWKANGINIGTTFALIIIFHLLITFGSNSKSAAYFQMDAERRESEHISGKHAKLLAEDDEKI